MASSFIGFFKHNFNISTPSNSLVYQGDNNPITFLISAPKSSTRKPEFDIKRTNSRFFAKPRQ